MRCRRRPPPAALRPTEESSFAPVAAVPVEMVKEQNKRDPKNLSAWSYARRRERKHSECLQKWAFFCADALGTYKNEVCTSYTWVSFTFLNPFQLYSQTGETD